MPVVGRQLVHGYYDYQEIRKKCMNRIRDIIRKIDKGIEFNEVEDKQDKKLYLKEYSDSKLLKILEKVQKEKKLNKDEYEYIRATIDLAMRSKKIEKEYKNKMMVFVEEEEIYNQFLKHIKGIAPVITACLVSEIEYCEDFDSVSKLWRYAGMHLVCPECIETVERKNGKAKIPLCTDEKGICPKCGKKGVSEKRRKGCRISHNPRLKKLVWLITKSFIYQKTPLYYEIYEKEKKRQKDIKYPKGVLKKRYSGYKETDTQLSKGHAHSRAKRKVGKIFLQHYWVKAREIKGLKTGKPWQFEHGDKEHTNYISWQDALEANQ